MKLDEAKATAIGMTTRFGADFAVFRLAGWVAEEYGVRRADELPKDAEIAETFTFDRVTTPGQQPAAAAQETQQRGLFE